MFKQKYAKAIEDIQAGRRLEQALEVIEEGFRRAYFSEDQAFKDELSQHKAEALRRIDAAKPRISIPGLGTLIQDRYSNYRSEPIAIPVLGGKLCRIRVEAAYADDSRKKAYHTAIANFLALPESVLKEAGPHVFQYYQAHEENLRLSDEKFVPLASPDDVWSLVRFADEPTVMRQGHGTKGVYVSLECGCVWEPEHGLQIVFKNGLKVNKVGPFDGHLTNTNEDEIYEA